MRIGVMLRGVDKRGGIGVYARNLVPRLVRLGRRHDWWLLHPDSTTVGLLDLPDDAREIALPGGPSVWWDQVTVPRFARRGGIDLLFNVKFTVPLTGPVPAAMAVHGMSWYVIPHCYPWWDVAFVKLAMPRYARRAVHLVSNSECTTRDYVEILDVPPEKISTVPLAAADLFRPVDDADELDRVRDRYGLPERFVLSVGAHDPRKNVERLLEAWARTRRRHAVPLVLVGRGCERYREEMPELMEEAGEDVVFPGWIDQDDLPAIYSRADVFFFPSLYEEFGIPNCEAMACGTPVVTSDVGAPPEIVGDAGVLVDPTDVEEMAAGLDRVLGDDELRRRLSEKGLERSRRFTWERTARGTLAVLDRLEEAP